MNQNFTNFAFTESVKNKQTEFGSREPYARMEKSGDKYILTERETNYIQSRDSFYLGTVGETGWPYVQFRGGPRGFLKVIDNTTIAYADFRGNRQYISTGNMNDSNKTSLFLIDYPSQTRLKIWAESTIINADENVELLNKLDLDDYDAKVEQLIVFNVKAYDWNCPKHITPRFTLDELQHM